jgi:hydrogenase expression/formation protein HypC
MCLGIPGKVVKIYDSNGTRMGKVDFSGIVKDVCLEYVPEVGIGDYTIIHVGFALHLISEEEAQETLDLLRQIAETSGEDPLAEVSAA